MMVVVGGQQAAGHWAVIMERCNFRRVIIITAGCPHYSCKRTFTKFELLRLMKVPTSASTIKNLLDVKLGCQCNAKIIRDGVG